jgi:hypothetical protein
MTSLHSLTQSAMLGSADDSLLVSAIQTGIAELGGYIPATFEGKSTACPPESQPQMPEKAAGLLKRLVAGEFDGLLPEFLQLTAERGYIVPPETLPALLGLGKNDLRKLVLPVIGERGRWLAAHNPAWAYALGRDPRDAWENGVRVERIAALEQIRASEPGKAREWIQASWEQDSPEDRSLFLGACSVGLSLEDEPFLETCLDDKRKEVRDEARGLLLRLEDSRFVGRMWARIKPLVRIKSKFLGGDSLEVSLPDGSDSDARRDGLGGAPLRKKMGEKANLLAQMVSFIPPALWSREFNRPPEKILSLALGHQWKEALLLGWALAAQGARDAAWAEAILRLAASKAEVQSVLETETLRALVMLLDPEPVQAIAQSSIKPILNELKDDSPLLTLLQGYRRPWTPGLARTVIQSAQRQAGKGWRLAHALPGFAQCAPPELAHEFEQGWSDEISGVWSLMIEEFLRVLNFRNEIKKSLKENQ